MPSACMHGPGSMTCPWRTSHCIRCGCWQRPLSSKVGVGPVGVPWLPTLCVQSLAVWPHLPAAGGRHRPHAVVAVGQRPRYINPSSTRALTCRADTSSDQARQGAPAGGSHQARCQRTQVPTLALSKTSPPPAHPWAGYRFAFPGLAGLCVE